MVYLSHVELSYTTLKWHTANNSLCYAFFITIVYRLLVFILKTSKFYPSAWRCVKMHISFFMHKASTFTSRGFVIT